MALAKAWVLASPVALLAGAVGVLAVAWWLKSVCLTQEWGAGFEYRSYCYSDVQALYESRAVGPGWPYVDNFNEYPVLTGLFMRLAADPVVSSDLDSYFRVTALALGVLMLAVTWMLHRMGVGGRAWLWVASPAVALYSFYNWDLLAVAAVVAGLGSYQHGRWGAAGALLGLGFCAKLFPVLLMPALAVAIVAPNVRGAVDAGAQWETAVGLAARDGRAWRFGGAFLATAVAVNLPFFLAHPSLAGATYGFQFGRAPNFETLWYMLGDFGAKTRTGWMEPFWEARLPSPLQWLAAAGALLWLGAALRRRSGKAAAAIGIPALALAALFPGQLSSDLLLAGVAVSCLAASSARVPPVGAASIALLAFLAFDKVLSLQYVLWALPLLVLSPVPVREVAWVLTADVATFVALMSFNAEWSANGTDHLFVFVTMAVLVRCAVYVGVGANLARRGWPGAPRTARP